jgi:ABC-type glycerol-3-phosphate transport system substrate-binding protein
MKKQFPLILMGVFGIFIFLAVLLFSGAIKVGKDSQDTGPKLAGANLTMWGVLPREAMVDPIASFSQENQITLNYIQKSQDQIDRTLGEAIASGSGPDIVLASHELLLKHRSKFVHTPYTTYSERVYRDTYIDGARVFLLPDGILAFPLLVDPLIFFFNRVSYTNAGLLEAPKTWGQVTEYSTKLLRKSGQDSILEAGISLGSFNNIINAKDILSLLLLQAGNPIVSIGGTVDAPEIAASLIRSTATTGRPPTTRRPSDRRIR